MRKGTSLILGLIFLALGLTPLLNSFGVIGFSLNAGSFGIILWILAVIGGVWLLWDGMVEGREISPMAKPTLIIAFVLLAFGLIPLLNSFGVIGFSLPGFAGILLDILLTLAGLFLLIGGVQGF